MSIKATLEEYPDVSFIDNLTLEELRNEILFDYQTKLSEITGKTEPLAKADPYRFILYACTLQSYQGFQYIDRAGKQGLLKYSYRDFLEDLGSFKRISRNQGKAAHTVIRFLLSELQTSVIWIPMGTRVTTGDNVFFYTTKDAEIPIGEWSVEVPVSCTEIGDLGNRYEAGKINSLVDPIPYMGSIVNTVASEGGTEIESDESLAERIFLAPSSYSVAGPEDAYKYHVKTCNPSTTDVKITSPSDGVVDIRFITQSGEIPSESMISEMQTYLSDNKIRPLTDKVVVAAPEVVKYDIVLTYWINRSDKNRVITIQNSVKNAVETYQAWQREKIGRDINPDRLLFLLIQAGAKRVEITSPVRVDISDIGIAIPDPDTATINFGGIEDD